MPEILPITKESILNAAKIIDQNPSLRKGRGSIEYDLIIGDKRYPPILILSEANRLLGGEGLLLSDFNNSTKNAFKIFEDLKFKVVKKMFSWLPFYKEMASWVLQFQDRQLDLIDIIRKVGFVHNLEDEDNNGKIPLTEIDPFTFFAFFQKLKNTSVRIENLKKLKDIVGLKAEIPSDFNGLPSAQPMSVRFFTVKKFRDPKTVIDLWNLSKQAVEGNLDAELFNITIERRGVKIAKLSQGLFWLNPEKFYPIDVHKNYLEERGINTEIETLEDYNNVLREIRLKLNKPFYEISYEAWKSNQEVFEENIIKSVNIWVEKTIVEDRQDRIEGDRAVGKALWSPTRDKGGKDIYKNMRSVKKGDIVLHLINNKEFSGLSIVEEEAIETTGLQNTEWEGPAYLVKLENYVDLNPPLQRTDLLIEKNRGELLRIANDSEVFYNSKLDLRQGAYLTPCPTQLLNLINDVYEDKTSQNLPLINELNLLGQSEDQNDNLTYMAADQKYDRFLLSIKTKPFIILAGFSGTGKSRLARTLAYKFNNIENDKTNLKHPPSNFQLIKVKPNWHDSSELLGYESRISGKDRFIVTDFMRFLVKAWQFPNTPFFLCLDEMNLAPVEQYFAEYLSSIESRRLTSLNKIKTDPLISSSLISKYADKNNGIDVNYDLWRELELSNTEIQEELKSNGLGIPPNLIVMGTVNMDETTHSFSRKVLDRAMTIEMNDFDLSKGLTDNDDDWTYPEFPLDKKLVLSEKTQGSEVFKELARTGNQVIDYLNLINQRLENSPFKIAYRVRDEFLLFAYNYSLLSTKPDSWISDSLDEMTLMKILPRIEGDEDKTKFLDDLVSVFQNNNLSKSLKKILEMIERRRSVHYTSFWS